MKAFLFIDLQNEFLSPQGALQNRCVKDVNQLTESISALVSWIRMQPSAIPIWVQADYSTSRSMPPSCDRKGKMSPTDIQRGTHTGQRRMCIPGSFGHGMYEPIADVIRPTDVVISKQWYSSFKETALQSIIFIIWGFASRLDTQSHEEFSHFWMNTQNTR